MRWRCLRCREEFAADPGPVHVVNRYDMAGNPLGSSSCGPVRHTSAKPPIPTWGGALTQDDLDRIERQLDPLNGLEFNPGSGNRKSPVFRLDPKREIKVVLDPADCKEEPRATCPDHPGDYGAGCRACEVDRDRYRQWKRARCGK